VVASIAELLASLRVWFDAVAACLAIRVNLMNP
jgi:hypothetical protein